MSKHGRREFFKTAGAAATAAFLSPLSVREPIASVMNDSSAGAGQVRLGVASYSLRALGRSRTIRVTKELGTPYINIKSFHLPYYLSPEDLAKGRKEFEKAGLEIVGGGNNTISEDTDEHVQMFFDYARHAGIPLLVIAPTHDNLKRIEKFVKQYDIKVAIHNHGPEDKYFPRPSDALDLIKDLDPRFGLCIDIGHTVRTGADVVQEIADAGDRVLDMHVQDLRDLTDKGSQCVVGEGKMPIVEIFKQLKKMGYKGYVNLEYEIDEDDPVAGMKQSFAYMRGVLAGLEG
jgi:sugar phosphate isomerase/epimerase